MKSLLYLNDILTNTESVSLFSQANLENSLKREYADIIFRYRYGRGAAAYFIFKVFQNLLAEIGFGATLSAYYNGLIRHRQAKLGKIWKIFS